MNPSDDWFYTRNLIIVFFVSLFLLILSGLFEYYFYIRKPFEGPIHKYKLTLDYRVKKWIAKFLIKLSKQVRIPDHLVDKLVAFNDKDKQVRSSHFELKINTKILTNLIIFVQVQPVDAVYFNTSSKNGQVLVLGTARRRNGLVDTIGILKVPEFSSKLLVLPIFPKTSLYQTAEEQKNLDSYKVAGIKIKSVVPKKEYQLEYKGKMVVDSSFRKEVDVEMFAEWRSKSSTFDFSTELSKIAKCEALALEPWSRKYFRNLKRYTTLDPIFDALLNSFLERLLHINRNENMFGFRKPVQSNVTCVAFRLTLKVNSTQDNRNDV